jgi:hypothetical protein
MASKYFKESSMSENTMFGWMRQLDRLLRGEATRLSALRQGVIELPENGLSLVILLLGVIYGLCMGTFALFNKPVATAVLQMISSMAKVPALFFITLLVTFPSLYVFNALVGSRLTLSAVWRLLIAMMAVMMAVLASLGPIVAFFSLSTNNYSFMLVLNVVVFAVSGFLGLKFLLHTLHRLSIVLKESSGPETKTAPPATTVPPATTYAVSMPPKPDYCVLSDAQWAQTVAAAQAAMAQGRATHWIAPRVRAQGGRAPLPTVPASGVPEPALPAAEPSGALERVDNRMLGSDVMTVFYLWIIVFGTVGAQMSWVLRPFISAPNSEFVWLRARESNFFTAVLHAVGHLFGGS